jgi:hypothetical protein
MSTQPPWLEGYASNRFDWHAARDASLFYRRVGLIERRFNIDGTQFEGRADLSMHLHVKLKTRLSRSGLRARILLVWSVMRQKHPLLSARVVAGSRLGDVGDDGGRFYVFDAIKDPSVMLEGASNHVVFLEDHHIEVNLQEFFVHTLNTGRCLDQTRAMSKLYVMPVKGDQLHVVLVAGHEIVDGLTSMRWMSSLIDLLNLSAEQLAVEARQLCSLSPAQRLPPAQETL